ncbi:hypothetical protein Pla175_05610 [Pirellulimonas nuda]|uniref:Ice-binding protein C-terminal domain-containing protein n=1 Tax=Pirellulimonas nuda TaxID=2528009 RepID=A0A518D6U2_9BACT|nr:PEP-CTERM sorting domain-containing protein [Pirellulimonas nuda]QDU87204.1 hypothetical protein Pla175_05610 [Pirellulimonas nuda]
MYVVGSDPNAVGAPGDYNGDSFVDAADYTVWRDNLGLSLTNLQNTDPNNLSGTVQASDYDYWKDNFPGPAVDGAIGGAPVPEPASWLLLAGGVALAAAVRRR